MDTNYADILNPSKYILDELLKNNRPMRWTEIKKSLTHSIKSDKSIKMAVDQLMDLGLIIKDKEPFHTSYRINKKHKRIALILARKHLDKEIIESQHTSKLIDLSAQKSKTSIYGLNRNIFYNSSEDSRNLNIMVKETCQFFHGIKSSELLGKTYATPTEVKMKLKNNSSEKEIIEAEVEHYANLLTKTKNSASIIKLIIERYRNFPIRFEEVGEGVTNKLLELKKEHRYSLLEETYRCELPRIHNPQLSSILKEFEEEFLKILNHSDVSRFWLEQAIFELHGRIGFSFPENRQKLFSKAVEGITPNNRDSLFNFLLKVYELNKDLWPTHVIFLARSS